MTKFNLTYNVCAYVLHRIFLQYTKSWNGTAPQSCVLFTFFLLNCLWLLFHRISSFHSIIIESIFYSSMDMSSTNTTQKIDWQIFVRNLVLYFMQYSQKISHKWLFSGNGNNAGIKTDLTVRGISNIWFASFTIVCISLLFVFWKTEKETRLRAQTNTHTLQSHITGIHRHQYFILGEHLFVNVF